MPSQTNKGTAISSNYLRQLGIVGNHFKKEAKHMSTKAHKSALALALLLLVSAHAYPDGKSYTGGAKSKNTPTGIDRDFSNENLFTGDVAFSIPLVNFGGVQVALTYNSNVHKMIRAENKDHQAG